MAMLYICAGKDVFFTFKAFKQSLAPDKVQSLILGDDKFEEGTI